MSSQWQINGRAVECTGGKLASCEYYGTYRRDIPDPEFRFKIALVEETDEFPLHSHEYSEILIALAGQATHLTELGEYRFEAGDAVVIHGDRRHGLRDVQSLKSCLIMFDPKQFLPGRDDLRALPGFQALFESVACRGDAEHFRERLHLSPEDMAQVNLLTTLMKAEFEGKSPGRKTMLASTFALLVTCLCRAFDERKDETQKISARIARVLAYMRQHFREALRIKDLARLASWSPSQFQRNFRRHCGLPPLRYIQQLRLREACELLADPDRDITTIAFECGFGSSSFFATQFKRAYGESPSSYRRRESHRAGWAKPPDFQGRMNSAPAAI